MALTVDHFETVGEMLRKDPEYRVAVLNEAATCLINGEPDVAKVLLRDYVKATIGFKKVAKMIKREPQTVMRMFRSSGKPSLDNISKLLASLHKHEGVEPRVSV